MSGRPRAGAGCALAVAAMLMLVGCEAGESPVAPEPTSRALAISDGAHGGTAGFYFLAPTASEPVTAGTFDPALAPEVRVCVLAGAVCASTVATFSASTSPAVTVNLEEEAYSVLWRTKEQSLDPGTSYRIEVRVGSVQLGFADLDVVTSPAELKQVSPEFVGLVVGRPLLIRFRVETGIVGQITVSPASGMVGMGSTLQFTATFLDLHGAPVPAPPVVDWSSSAPAVAAVDGAGLATGLTPGEAMITAASGQASGSASLLVLHDILFSSDRSGDRQLYLLSPGGAPSIVTAGLDPWAFDGDAVWAADGQRIALALEAAGSDPFLNVLPLGGTPLPLAPGTGQDWSPDGSRLAFHHNAGPMLSGNEIWLVGADGTGLLELTSTNDNDIHPRWSPNGAWIAFVRSRAAGSGLYIIRPDGTGLTHVSSDLELGLSTYPDWSPDGSRILYHGSPSSLSFFDDDLYVANADGTNEVQLTATPGLNESDATWSPDGTRILFMRSEFDGNTVQGDLWVMNADGTGEVNLTGHTAAYGSPAWSPDGRAIVFNSTRDGNAEIYVMLADGSALLRVTNHAASDSSPSWRPVP